MDTVRINNAIIVALMFIAAGMSVFALNKYKRKEHDKIIEKNTVALISELNAFESVPYIKKYHTPEKCTSCGEFFAEYDTFHDIKFSAESLTRTLRSKRFNASETKPSQPYIGITFPINNCDSKTLYVLLENLDKEKLSNIKSKNVCVRVNGKSDVYKIYNYISVKETSDGNSLNLSLLEPNMQKYENIVITYKKAEEYKGCEMLFRNVGKEMQPISTAIYSHDDKKCGIPYLGVASYLDMHKGRLKCESAKKALKGGSSMSGINGYLNLTGKENDLVLSGENYNNVITGLIGKYDILADGQERYNLMLVTKIANAGKFTPDSPEWVRNDTYQMSGRFYLGQKSFMCRAIVLKGKTSNNEDFPILICSEDNHIFVGLFNRQSKKIKGSIYHNNRKVGTFVASKK